MLESIKEILVNEMMHELQEHKQIEQEIEILNRNEKKENLQQMDKKMAQIEKEIEELSKNAWNKLRNRKKINELQEEYKQVAIHKIEKLEQYNSSRNNLLTRLQMVSHDQKIMKQDIKRIQQANSLEDLNLTEEKAKALLRRYHHHEETSAIQQAFLKMVEERITTQEEIEAKMKYLYQTNASSFYVEMNKISPREFVRQLVEVGIEIEKEKITFLEEFSLSPNTVMFSPVTLDKKNELDHYFNNEVQTILNRLKKSPTLSNMALSQIMSLAALVSIAKNNKKNKK